MKIKRRILNLLLLFFVLLILSSCNKTPDGLDVKTADFSLDSNPIFISQTLKFVAQDSLGGHAYSWNFGDGISLNGSHSVTHQFAEAGDYTVTLSINGFKTSRKITVHRGTMSFRIINNSSNYKLNFLTYIDNYEDGSVNRFDLYSKSKSDTIFASGLGQNFHLVGISIFVKNSEYVMRPVLVYDFHHQDVIVTDSTELHPRSSFGNQPSIVLLSDL